MNAFSKKMNEKQLLFRIIHKKDADAFAKVYDAYVEKIYRFIFFKVSNVEEAQDLTSDVFLKVWKYLTNGKKKELRSLSGLLYTTARNSIIDTYRKKALAREESLDNLPIDPAADENLHDMVSVKQDAHQLLGYVKKLKHEYQEVILLRYIEELSVKEIADIIGKSQTNVRVLVHRAVKKLESIYPNAGNEYDTTS